MSKRIIGIVMLVIPCIGLIILGGELVGYLEAFSIIAGVLLFVVWLFIALKLLVP